MNIEIESHGDIDLVKLRGKLDVHSTPKLLEMLEDLISSGNLKIVLDMEEVQFISSYGLGALVTIMKSVSEKGGALKLAALRKELRVSFGITGLDSKFEFFDDSKQALDSFLS